MIAKKLSSSHPIKHLDVLMLISIAALSGFGALLIYSATANSLGFQVLRIQLIWIIIGTIGFVLMASFDYQKLKTYSGLIYGACSFALVLVIIIGRIAGGAQRWLSIGPFNLQPSEFSKLGLVIVLAALLSRKKEGPATNREIGLAIIYSAILLMLVFIQPDLGTALVFLAIAVGMLFASGINALYLVGLLVAGIVAVPISIRLHILKPYQIQRLLVFLDPSMDPSGAGYNLVQSKIAIGSGELVGRGLFLGTQTRLNFIPHSHTDFVFAVLGEQLGFLGAIALLALFCLLLWRIAKTAQSSRDMFGTLICIGILVSLIFQAFVNIGMTIGIMPITGIPLPLISYGGSSYLATMLGLGLVMNVYMRRYGGKTQNA